MQSIAMNSPREFVAAEQPLRASSALVREAADLPQLGGEEAGHLRASAALLLQLRLRREHPVLARLMSLIHGRMSAERPHPLSVKETQALVALTGALSHGENDLFNHLRDIGAVSDATFRDVVVPHRERNNREQGSQRRSLRWGLASFLTSVSPMAVGLGVLAVATGPVGQIAAALAGLAMGLGVAPRVQAALERAARRENVLVGVDATQGHATATEAGVIVDRAARGAVYEHRDVGLVEQLRRELALCELLLATRRSASDARNTSEIELTPLAARYHRGLASILDDALRERLPEAKVRERLTRLRAETLTPDLLERSARRQLGAATVDAARPRSPEDALLHGARDRARLERASLSSITLLLRQILPSLGGMAPSLEPQVREMRPLAGGGYEVRGHFSQGLLKPPTGAFRLRVADDGSIDTRTLSMDVGEGGAAEIAALAAGRHQRLTGAEQLVRRVDVRRVGTESRPRYVAQVYGRTHARPLRVIVTGFGLPEWEHLLVTPSSRERAPRASAP